MCGGRVTVNAHCMIGSAGHVAGATHGLNCPNDIAISDSGDALLIANWSGHNVVSVPWPDRLEEPAGARYDQSVAHSLVGALFWPAGSAGARPVESFHSHLFLFLIHRSHSISFTRAQGIRKYKIGFGLPKPHVNMCQCILLSLSTLCNTPPPRLPCAPQSRVSRVHVGVVVPRVCPCWAHRAVGGVS
jgi:hypothetical protein